MTDKIIRYSKPAILHELSKAGVNVDKPSAIRCPFHDDQHPSAGVYVRPDGAWAFKCHGCGVNYDILDLREKLAGVPVADQLRPTPEAKPVKRYESLDVIKAMLKGKLEHAYVYTNPDTGTADLAVLRWTEDGRKRFWQAHHDGQGWVLRKPDGLLPLYNRARVRDADEVILVEGEKCVHALHTIGIIGTTWPGGCNAPDKADWSPLAGKTVTLWPDNDDNGRKAMQTAAEHLGRLDPPAKVRWVDPADAGITEPGGDVANLIEAGKSDAVESAIAGAKQGGPSAALAERLKAMMDGRWIAVPLPWPALDRMTQALLPGTVTLMCGEGGSSKSFWLLQCLIHWHANGIPCAVMEMEDDQTYHLNRLLAMLTEHSQLTNAQWVQAHADRVQLLMEGNADLIDSYGPLIHDCPSEGMTLGQLADWAEARAKAGARVVAIDPVTAAEPEKEPWSADKNFLKRIENAMVQYGASAVLVTHPRGNTKGRMTQDDMAGGRAYPRFAKTAFGMSVHAEGRRVTVANGKERTTVTCDRSIRILKARNGIGHGWELAYTFDKRNLQFEELGVIVEDEE